MEDETELEDTIEAPAPRRTALIVWCVCVGILLGPALLAWVVRLVALAASCAPNEGLCRGMSLGAGLRDTLSLAWAVSSNALLLVTVSLVATLAAFCKRKPVSGALSLFLLPLFALALPALVVYVSLYPGCRIDPDGIGDCVLWGANMGRSFHAAAAAPDAVLALLPTSVALTVMIGLIGWFFAHPQRRKPKTEQAPTMQMRRFGERSPFDGIDQR